MSERSAALLIDDILEAASKIASYTAGMAREDFVSSGMAAARISGDIIPILLANFLFRKVPF